MARKKFQDLNLKDAFLFGAALSDDETCRLILEVILGREVPDVKVNAEHTVFFSSDYRMVRLDVYAADSMRVGYNMEMQNQNEGNLPKRSRYHLSEMDVMSLKPGQSFEDLKPSYVIFICTFDPFGYGLYRYTFEAMCKERDFALGDETCRIFLNTKGQNEAEVPPELVQFLKYVEDSGAAAEGKQSVHIARIHERITDLKKSREWEARYMTLEEYLHQEAKEYGKELAEDMAKEMAKDMAQNMAEGMVKDIAEDMAKDMAEDMAKDMAEDMAKDMAEDMAKNIAKDMAQNMYSRFCKAASCLAADGQADKIPELEKNPEFLKEICEKYHL